MPLLHIKNMVCPRCIMAVEDILDELQMPYQQVELGEVVLTKSITKKQLKTFEGKIKSVGFELIESGKSQLISKIKDVIITQIHYQKEPLAINFSTLIAEKLRHEYAYLSRLFSSVEGLTIERFIARQKIEKVKELLMYNQMTLSQIADELHYSSVAHLSSQFKKETGMTPTQFKTQAKPSRKSLDDLHA